MHNNLFTYHRQEKHRKNLDNHRVLGSLTNHKTYCIISITNKLIKLALKFN